MTIAAASGGPQLTHLTKERAQAPKRRPPRKFKPMDEDDVRAMFTVLHTYSVCVCTYIHTYMGACVLSIGSHRVFDYRLIKTIY